MRRISDADLKNEYIEKYSLQNYIPTEIITSLELQLFEMGEYVYHQDEDAHTFYILVDGKLQIDYLHSNGNQTIFSLGEPLSTIGDVELFETFPAIKNVLVLKTSTLLTGSLETIRKYGQEDYRFLRFILHQIVKKLDFSSNQLAQTSLPLESRLARYLLVQLNSQGKVLDLERREVLAGILGTSVRHLNRTLKSLSEENIINVHYKTLEIIDPEKLVNAVNKPIQKGT